MKCVWNTVFELETLQYFRSLQPSGHLLVQNQQWKRQGIV